jgi:UDP-N-acetylmuramate dehydrogenase
MTFASLLTTAFPELPWQLEFELAPKTYFKVGGAAEIFLELTEVNRLAEIVRFCDQHQIPLTMLGGASNVIVSDAGVKGLVLHLKNDQVTPISDAEKITGLQAGAGTKMSTLVSQMLKLELTGLEYFLGVPGTVGGAIFNNAHYLSQLISTHVSRVHIMHPKSGQTEWLDQAECQFGYDQSRFQTSHELILEVEFALDHGDVEKSRALIKEATEYRAKTQPVGEPSSGCVFQNVLNSDQLRHQFPEFAERTHVPAGFLIDQAGLKGLRVGDIEVSQVHAAFMVNKGHGSSQDLAKLISEVKATVKSKFGVDLREEVFYLD